MCIDNQSDDEHEAAHGKRSNHERDAAADSVHNKEDKDEDAGHLDDSEEARDEESLVSSADRGKDLRRIVGKGSVASCETSER